MEIKSLEEIYGSLPEDASDLDKVHAILRVMREDLGCIARNGYADSSVALKVVKQVYGNLVLERLLDEPVTVARR